MSNVQVIAHRGASRAERENTLEAFRRAGLMGADAVELDVRRTADGAMAIHHDASLSDGRVICELQSVDLPAHIPMLSAALDACEGMWVNIEIKNLQRSTLMHQILWLQKLQRILKNAAKIIAGSSLHFIDQQSMPCAHFVPRCVRRGSLKACATKIVNEWPEILLVLGTRHCIRIRSS